LRDPAPGAAGRRMSTLSLQGTRILIVEDNFVVADALRYLIDGYGGSVSAIVPSVQRAHEALDTGRVDVAVLRINLNRASGRARPRHQPDGGDPLPPPRPPPRMRHPLRLPEWLRRRGAAAGAPAQPPQVRQAGRSGAPRPCAAAAHPPGPGVLTLRNVPVRGRARPSCSCSRRAGPRPGRRGDTA